MADTRDPYDGEPYYCSFCGSGWNEYQACEETDCKLEKDEVARHRQQRRRPVGSATQEAQRNARERE